MPINYYYKLCVNVKVKTKIVNLSTLSTVKINIDFPNKQCKSNNYTAVGRGA